MSEGINWLFTIRDYLFFLPRDRVSLCRLSIFNVLYIPSSQPIIMTLGDFPEKSVISNIGFF